MAFTDLAAESLGFHAEQVPAIEPTDISSWAQRTEFNGKSRAISPIPGHPDFYLRWVHSNPRFSEMGDDEHLESWHQQIQLANRHFRILEATGVAVPAQRHIAVERMAEGFSSTLYTVVPRYNSLTGLDAKKPAQAAAVADYVSRLALYTEACIMTQIPEFMHDLYNLGQASLDVTGQPVMHDTEIRLSPIAAAGPRACGLRHYLSSLAMETERQLRRNGNFAEAERLYDNSVLAGCMHHASAREILPAP